MEPIDPRVTAWRAKYCETLRLAHGWDVSEFFNKGVGELLEDLGTLRSSGTVTREQLSFLIMMLEALLDSQTRWLLREATIIEAAGAVKH